MSKPLGTIWNLDPHTAKKHEILRRYFEAWLPIMSSWSDRVVYIDGFAGPGKYSIGEDGSPVVVLKAARDHTNPMKSELVCVFVEDDKERCDHLTKVLGELTRSLPSRIKWEVVHGRFDDHLASALDLIEAQKKNLAPAFVFIDPFGFSHTPFKTVKRLLGNRRCEVLVNFMYEEVNRFISLEEHAANFDELFGTTEWRDVRRLSIPAQRRRAIHDIYLKQLKTGATYVHSFEMLNKGNSTAHLELRNTLDRAKAEMDAAAKTAQAEARSKTKSPAKKEPPKKETGAVETQKRAQPVKTEPPKTASLFDAPESAPSTATADTDEEEELLGAVEEDDQIDEDADLDEAA